MIAIDRKELLQVLVKVQRHLCVYSHDKDRDAPTKFCDCKFGGKNVGGTQEDNGCPELRVIIAMLGAITDEEYAKVILRLTRNKMNTHDSGPVVPSMTEEYLKDFPRRRRLEKLCPGELAVRNAVKVVEGMGADVLLTEAVNLLCAAQDKVSDYYDMTHTPIKEGSVNMKPLADRVVIKVLEADEVSPGGIHIPSTAKEKPQKGEVVAVGPGKVGDDSKIVPLSVKVGDKVLYSKYSGAEVNVDGQEYLIVKESDVLAVL